MALYWSIPGSCDDLESEAVDERPLCYFLLSVAAFQINKPFKKEKKNLNYYGKILQENQSHVIVLMHYFLRR